LARVKTLIVSHPNVPSILVLQPIEEFQEGKFRVVPIWVGPAEAVQIGAALEHAKSKRPLTHDLFLDALTNLDARIDHVVISDVEKNVFHAKLYIRQGDREIELDARPSDAVALAARQDCPIFIERDVVEKASFPYIVRTTINEEEELDEFRSFLQGLSPEDFEV